MNEAAERSQGRAAKSASAFRTISEVADELEVAQHVLRFWESKFPQVRPLKRGGGRRYYRPEDLDVLREIRSLLYDEGYTIRGAQKHLRGKKSARSGNGEEGVASDDARGRLTRLRAQLVRARDALRATLDADGASSDRA